MIHSVDEFSTRGNCYIRDENGKSIGVVYLNLASIEEDDSGKFFLLKIKSNGKVIAKLHKE